jgi:hypothetical protein
VVAGRRSSFARARDTFWKYRVRASRNLTFSIGDSAGTPPVRRVLARGLLM